MAGKQIVQNLDSNADTIFMSENKPRKTITLTDQPLFIDRRQPVVNRLDVSAEQPALTIADLSTENAFFNNNLDSEDKRDNPREINSFISKFLPGLPLPLIAWRAETGNCSIVYWHDFCQRLFGWTKEEMHGRNFLELLNKRDDRETVEMVIEKLGAKFLPSIMANVCHTRSKEDINIKWCHTPIFDESTGFYYIFSLAQQVADDVSLVENTTEDETNGLESDDQNLNNTLESIRTNVDMIMAPILRSMAIQSGEPEDKYVKLLNDAVSDLSNSFITRLGKEFLQLTPRDLEVCNMIRAGLSSKDIARSLHMSEQTVITQRKRIRRKLGIANSEIDLHAFLRAYES